MRSSFKLRRIVLVTMLMSAPLTAFASLVQIQFEIRSASSYDYTKGAYVPSANSFGRGAVTFDIDQAHSVSDYGSTTISEYLWRTTWDSPLTRLIPLDPNTGAYGGLPNSYTFPNVTDYASTFIEEAASQGNSYGTRDGINYSAYHIELRATKRSPPRHGDGSSDYAFTRQGLLDFYQSFVDSQAPVYFNESYQTYHFVGGTAVYSEGLSWSDYSATITKVTDFSNAVPEPATIALTACGISIIGALRRKRVRRV